MTDSDIGQVISDAQYSGQELQIRDKHGKVTFNTIQREEQNRLDLSFRTTKQLKL